MKKPDLNKYKKEFDALRNGQFIYIKNANSKMEYVHLDIKKHIKYFAAVLCFAGLLGFVILSYTPLNDLAVFNGKTRLEREKKEVEILNTKINYLSGEINKLRVINGKLNFIIRFSDNASQQNDSLKNEKKAGFNQQISNNLYSIFNKIIYIFAQEQVNKFFTKPVIGYISRGFEPAKGHNGIDIIAKTGTPVFAASPGYVVFSDFTNKAGYSLIIAHSDGFITLYKHCSRLLKKEREFVYANDIIALSGNTGEETSGPHLHFEIWKNGKPVDPVKYLLK